ncbi:methionyl-tRNA formyltransferase [Anaerocolumna aminovalerica]|uniref:Methionyl-tRNA formyltransferase n=1 Tax=Anaerocolumna aminovalerica TaxID=1527 RepID=A0A1I5FCA7_9FIRM|nr:methionyl-tRNA formyltransferase [Anaerocolumna aminovalerica]MBU5331807.1 methionyl-tRNA formyltransferase [Anaerocolumna aminovalerica]SFO21279.1 methionyl-tRNA formyltransferase [Anaerocolumna aminovalerica]
MKIVFMGTPELAATILDTLIQSEHEILAVVTQPDKPKGRGKQVQYPPVKELALEHQIPVYQPNKAKDEDFIKKLEEINPECIVVAAYGKILPKTIIDFPKYGCINVHASLLPKYRGAAPIQWTIINGEEKTGITIMYMDVGIDTGDMIMKEEVIIEPKETGGSLHDKLAVCGGRLLIKALKEIEHGTAVREKQKDEESTYVKMLDKSLGHIDFSNSAAEIERLIRGLNPWPSAYTFLDGKTLKIWEASVEQGLSEKAGNTGKPGEILEVTKDSIIVQTGNGRLVLHEVQLEGKKRMTVDAFIRGFDLQAGKILS